MNTVTLGNYDNEWYKPGRSRLLRVLWHFVGSPLVFSYWLPFSSVKVKLLRLFGARIGKNVTTKPGVLVKYPWHLVVGDDCWLGERCWIDNLTTVHLGNDVCISQGAYLCTGNHDWSDPSFGLMISPIQLNDGSWVGANALLGPGTVLGHCAVVSAGSVITGIIPDYEIYAGNPAKFVKRRMIRDSELVIADAREAR
jgi:putative colanic acid biosynthesis acetyltransferase WcaF